MPELTVTWIFFPFLIGFIAYLLPNSARFLASGTGFLSVIFSGYILRFNQNFTLELIDRYGVTLTIDSLGGYFILTNGLVTLAVIIYCWEMANSAYFYAQLIILHGSINSVFCCADFISLYVALEVIGIATFLLISYPRDNRSVWIALRYLFVSNTVMLFYLVGAILVFQNHNSFAFSALAGASPEGITLILLGLLTKGGIFLSGMWLPLTHAESDSPVSALLSGIVVKTGIFPIVRCAQMIEELAPVVELFSIASAAIGVGLGIISSDVKRIFAFSTISQLGYVLTGGNSAGFYALTHGLAKAGLFLSSGSLPTRQLKELTKIPFYLWFILTICSLSIIGFPLLSGFGAKTLTLEQLPIWQSNWLLICSIGSTIVFSPFIFTPFTINCDKVILPGLKWGSILLVISLLFGNIFYLEAYRVEKIVSTILTIGVGVAIYYLFGRRMNLNLKIPLEKFENLIGIMTIVAISIFGILTYELP